MLTTRQYWLDTMMTVIRPVLNALAEDRLREKMPAEGKRAQDVIESSTYLEAFGRIIMGIAPWLGCKTLTGKEEERRRDTAALVRRCLDKATDPNSRDHMNFSVGMQPIVDAAFLAQGILRAPHELWDPLPDRVKAQILSSLRATRTRKPPNCNWLLFSAMIECLIRYAGEDDWDPMRIDYAVRQHLAWYKGDGVYGDGPDFHADYYNSFVIQPMLVEITEWMQKDLPVWAKDWQDLPALLWPRLSHYATLLEHMISPEGTYPLIGRSLCYRFGAFQALSMASYRHRLEESITPAGVRCALTEIIRKTMAFENTFDADGWLRIGVCGYQPDMGEAYISTGSLYLCCAVFLPLGLSPDDPFWSDPDADWTMKALWNGRNRSCEHALV